VVGPDDDTRDKAVGGVEGSSRDIVVCGVESGVGEGYGIVGGCIGRGGDGVRQPVGGSWQDTCCKNYPILFQVFTKIQYKVLFSLW
jgi:hypothetical protein